MQKRFRINDAKYKVTMKIYADEYQHIKHREFNEKTRFSQMDTQQQIQGSI